MSDPVYVITRIPDGRLARRLFPWWIWLREFCHLFCTSEWFFDGDYVYVARS